MNRPELKVIQGGMPYLLSTKNKILTDAYVTDTRLMGVLAVCAHWAIPDGDETHHLHQFFYIDCEEAGLETYQSICGDDPEEISMVDRAMTGGLGADKIDIGERQLRAILAYYASFNEKHGLPLPEGFDEYGFLLEPRITLSEDESYRLMQLMCGSITSEYQVINYFLMRCFGQDEDGIRFLCEDPDFKNPYSSYRLATFCKNIIDPCPSGETTRSFLCESLVEMNGRYETIVSKITISNDLRVVSLERCSGFAVSAEEAAIMLSKPEFVTVYEVLLSDEDMDDNIGELTTGFNTIMSVHENGRLFMSFKLNNDHVNNRIFRLSDDVRNVYYLTDFGQLIVAAYSLIEIRHIERRLRTGPLAPFLMMTAKYEFRESVLFDFMHSDFEDFDDFLSFIKGE